MVHAEHNVGRGGGFGAEPILYTDFHISAQIGSAERGRLVGGSYACARLPWSFASWMVLNYIGQPYPALRLSFFAASLSQDEVDVCIGRRGL